MLQETGLNWIEPRLVLFKSGPSPSKNADLGSLAQFKHRREHLRRKKPSFQFFPSELSDQQEAAPGTEEGDDLKPCCSECAPEAAAAASPGSLLVMQPPWPHPDSRTRTGVLTTSSAYHFACYILRSTVCPQAAYSGLWGLWWCLWGPLYLWNT